MSWIDKLKVRWRVESAYQVIIILVVFACTGTTVWFIKEPSLDYLFGEGNMPLWASISYWVLILPIYNLLLLFYGLIFGQFRFFWEFEKRLVNSIISIFRKKIN